MVLQIHGIKALSLSSTSSSLKTSENQAYRLFLRRCQCHVQTCSNSIFHSSLFNFESKLKPRSMPTRPLTRASKLTVPCPFLSKSRSRPNKSQTKLPHLYAAKIQPALMVCNVLSDFVACEQIEQLDQDTLSVHYRNLKAVECLDKLLAQD